jgi:alkylhydroperoxidase family enzyme
MRASILFLLALVAGGLATAPGQADPPPARFPAAGNDEAWKLLPRQEPPLPAWARVLVRPLPRTTAAMLQLDYLHRGKNPLGPVLAGKARWAAADALGCDYARRYAEYDLKQAGLGDAELKRLAGAAADLPKTERAVLKFARQMTRAAFKVTDAEVAELLEQLGPEKLVALVHTLAYANFHGRLLLALGVEIESDGPLPPLDLKLDTEKLAKVKAPPRPAWDEVQKAKAPVDTAAPDDWGDRTFADLLKAVEQQKTRQSRIPLPDPSRFASLPPEAREQALKVIWTNVSMGYQPQMTKAWFDCMSTFRQEAPLNRVFSSSVFWVVTRSNDCFY